SVGMVIVPLALLRLRQAGRRWQWALLGSSLAMLPWLLWSVGARRAWTNDPVEGYYTDYVGWWLSFGLPALTRVITSNTHWIVAGVCSMGLDGIARPLQQANFMGWIVFFDVLGLIALGALLWEVRAGRILPTCLAAYLVLISVWPWAPLRFLSPILPFLVVYLLRGLETAARRLVPARGFSCGVVVVGVALAFNLAGWAQIVRARHQTDTTNPELGA